MYYRKSAADANSPRGGRSKAGSFFSNPFESNPLSKVWKSCCSFLLLRKGTQKMQMHLHPCCRTSVLSRRFSCELARRFVCKKVKVLCHVQHARTRTTKFFLQCKSSQDLWLFWHGVVGSVCAVHRHCSSIATEAKCQGRREEISAASFYVHRRRARVDAQLIFVTIAGGDAPFPSGISFSA